VVVAVLIGAVAWYQSQMGGSGGAATVVTVSAGASMGSVTASLVRAHVVDSSLAFRVYLALHGTPTVVPGSYLMHRDDSFGDVRTRLAAGPDVFAVTVLPGTTVREVAAGVGDAVPRFSGAAFTAAATSPAHRSPWQPPGSGTLDGLLGTGTYIVLPKQTEGGLVQQMIDRFDTEATRAGLASAATADGVAPYQAVIVASIVQKEAISPGDSAAATAHNAGPVARVIYNRLDHGTALQMDSTVLYALDRDGGTVTAADLATVTPYNTYLNTGLTPTPICFPSATALNAALHPPAGSWLYFELTSRDGTETFSDTLAEHEQAISLAHSRGLP
ncbi:MAG: endolytic transglycosylase MltG, partial [Acidimicrobiales bacterium]